MKKSLLLASILLVLIPALVACDRQREFTVLVTPTPTNIPLPQAVAQAPRALTLLVGAGQDTTAVNAFLPTSVRIRAGDTVIWKINSDDIHTVAFLPGAEGPQDVVPIDLVPVPGGGPRDVMINPRVASGTRPPGAPVETHSGAGFFSSGIMSKEPLWPGPAPKDTFTLTFDAPGTFEYICLVHPYMRATITVEEVPTRDVPSQAEIDAQAREELVDLMAQVEGLSSEASKTVRSELGTNGTTIWHVQAGAIGFDRSAELYEFLPKDITIQVGDTVIWTSKGFHQVTFHPGRLHPEFIVPTPQDRGPPLLIFNPEVLWPHKPFGEFDGTGFWSSGFIGSVGLPGGNSFAMTFSKAGRFKYMCAIHRELGMEASITVTERKLLQVAEFDAAAAEFPQGLAVDQQGNTYVGIPSTVEIRKVTPEGEVSTFAKLPSAGGGMSL